MYAELCAQAFVSVFKVFMLSYSQPHRLQLSPRRQEKMKNTRFTPSFTL